MKSLILLLKHVLQDCSTYCGTTTTRDFETISRRVEHEGISFLTITLGDFATDFESCLERGSIEPTDFASFSKAGPIPKLFSGMVALVFNEHGRLLDSPSIAAVFCIRQVCRMWKKIELPCTEERNLAAIDGYIKVESELSMLDLYNIPDDLMVRFGKVADLLWGRVLAPIDFTIGYLEHIPNHGNGATATKVLQNQKYNWSTWHHRLETFFPSSSFCYYNENAFLDQSQAIAYSDPEQEQPVRVVFVPKTLKTPRVIGIEPACMQYTQQSLLTIIVDQLEKHPLTRGSLNYTDQTINAKLALSSSKDCTLATLDLSEASDRVHHVLVMRMLQSVPNIQGAVFACRSTRATLPSGKTIQLEKFASMGSAMCFPIESMVFYTILVEREIHRLRLPLKQGSVEIVKRNLFVYGDDLIIPVGLVPSATLALSQFGLKVNSRKSFSKGNFRESCGVDAYDGVDVTSVYLRRPIPHSRRDVSGVVSFAAFGNQLFKKGFFRAADHVEEVFSKRLRMQLPYVTETSACVGHIRDVTPTVHRRCDKLHRPEVKGLVVVSKKQSDPIDGQAALMKWFLKGLNPDKKHYLRSAGTGNLAIKTRWCSVY